MTEPAPHPPADETAGEGTTSPTRRVVGVALAVGLAGWIWLAPSELQHLGEHGDRPAAAAAVAVLMAVLWLTEAIPMAWTACLPLVLHPLLGVYGGGPVADARAAVGAFADGYLLLFLGGMVLGASMEQWHLHRRIALNVLRRVGADPGRLLLGVLVATAAISMWISNTATAVMMLPIAMALQKRLEADAGRPLPGMGCALALAVAYAANVGGIGTKIGTGTNSIFTGFVSERMGLDLGFGTYLLLGAPFVVAFVPVLWVALWSVARRDMVGVGAADDVIADELAGMGPMSARERQVAVVFGLAAVLWIFGDPLRGAVGPWLPALWDGFVWKGKHWEALVAMTAAAGLAAGGAVSWRAFVGIPWSALLLLGGSFAMAAGIEGSGLSGWMASKLSVVASLPMVGQLAVAAGASVFLSAVASNTATINVLLQVLPRSMPVLTAAAFGASCDFMLPAGTPPNAIVFGSGYVRLPTMIRVGFALDLAAVAAITVYAWLWVTMVLGP